MKTVSGAITVRILKKLTDELHELDTRRASSVSVELWNYGGGRKDQSIKLWRKNQTGIERFETIAQARHYISRLRKEAANEG